MHEVQEARLCPRCGWLQRRSNLQDNSLDNKYHGITDSNLHHRAPENLFEKCARRHNWGLQHTDISVSECVYDAKRTDIFAITAA